MPALFDLRLETLAHSDRSHLLASIQRGIEKESLRVTGDGKLAQTPHPQALGSALTHPYITTDYSEALLEFITPVYTSIEDTLQKLDEIHRFTCAHLDGELLWAASMPCILTGDRDIPLARYGSSNIAQMKTVYRRGLGLRYGRLMQTISGIHYNFSMPMDYWPAAQRDDGDEGDLRDYITGRYLGLIRNFRRHSWLLAYLFGASPAVCASFVRDIPRHGLTPFDPDAKSLHAPHGTALRMGNLGYSSDTQKKLNICYNGLDSYIETLREAIVQPHPAYRDIGLGDSGNRLQLNTGLLQIENEFYSPIRPKRVTRSGKTPLGALREGGIEYIEVRCVDVNPFLPLGIDAEQARFIDSFLLYCLLSESPPCDCDDSERLRANMEQVVNRGREPGLELATGDGAVPLTALARQILDATAKVADTMDAACGGTAYADSQRVQAAKVEDPGLTPSARILDEMGQRQLPFFHLAMQYSEEWARHFRERPLDAETLAHFEQASRDSHSKQARVEAADDMDFDSFLGHYYRQYDDLAD